jgi:hypothetical protein
LMTWVCSPSLCKCAASWVASLANPVIAIWVSPGEPEDVLNFSSSRHISSYLVHLWGLRLRSICHRLFQDVSRSLKHSSTVLKLVAFAKWSVKAFFSGSPPRSPQNLICVKYCEIYFDHLKIVILLHL